MRAYFDMELLKMNCITIQNGYVVGGWVRSLRLMTVVTSINNERLSTNTMENITQYHVLFCILRWMIGSIGY